MSTSRRAAVVTILAALLGVVLLDAALFRTQLYLNWIQPDSSTGVFEYRLRAELDRQREPGNLVVTLGNSRFAYLPRVANQYTAESGYVFRQAGVAGSTVREWYYMLRDLDPTARRYQAVVLGFDDLEDEESAVDERDDPRSLHYVVGRLRFSDAWDYARSHRLPAAQWRAFRGTILKGIVLQSDLHEFLRQPRARIESVNLNWKGWAGWTYDYDDEERSLAGLSIDWQTRQITAPPGMNPGYQKMLRETVLRTPAAPNGWNYAFHKEWVGRIVNYYRDSPTRVVFIRLPRGPLGPPTDLAVNPQSSLRQFAQRRKVLLGDPRRYRELERPDYFKDPLHLNRAGAHAFSKMLVDEVRELIGPPR